MNIEFFKDSNGHILFSRNPNDSTIKLIPKNSNITANAQDIFITNMENEKILLNTSINAIGLAIYFAGNKVYNDFKHPNNVKPVLQRDKTIKILNDMGYSSDLVNFIIKIDGNLPVDFFVSSNHFKNIKVSSEHNKIKKVQFHFNGLNFIDLQTIDFDSLEELKTYVKYRFWGMAELDGKKIEL